MRACLATQMQEVFEARVRDERRAGAFPLEQRVRRDRRPVREPLEIVSADGTGRLDDGFLLSRRGDDLRSPDLPLIEENCIRERAADVDAEDRHS